MRVAALALAFVSMSCSSARARWALPVIDAIRPNDPGEDARAAEVVSYASAQVGKRYCWGGEGPACFDCSGLVQRAWAFAGVRVPRTSGAIASQLAEVSLDHVRAGDILWWPGHVGIYAGRGLEVEALDARDGVVRRREAHPRRAFRPWSEAGVR
ncbi:MAG: C40 family peptidase [Polyangiaceae bacterium]